MARFLRTYGIAGIRAPAVVGNGIYFAPIQTVTEVARKASNSAIRNTRRGTVYRLRPAILDAAPPVVAVYYGPKVYLTELTWRRRRRRPQMPGLLPVPITGAAVVFYGPRVYTVRNRPKPTTYRLRPPTVVTAVTTEVFTGPDVTLAYSRRGVTHTILRPPLGIVGIVNAPIAGYLTPPRSRNPVVHYALRGPTVVGTEVSTDVFGGPRVKLIPLRRATPPTTHRLAPPTVVSAAAVYYGPAVHLVRRRRPIVKSRLLPVPSAFQPVGRVVVHLTYSRRGVPKSVLRKPVVIDLSPQVYYPSVWLARNKPKPTTHFLRPPTDLVDQQDVGRLAVHLTYSRRGKAKPRLWPVPAAFQPVGFVRVHLTYSLRGKPKSILRPPTVIDLRPQVYSITTWLTYSRRGTPKSRLAPPTVVTAASTEAYYGPQVTLVRRPTPKTIWHLGAPQNIQALVFAPIQGYLTLPRSTRPKTLYELRPPTTVVVTDVFYGPTVSLAYSRRARPKSILRAPIIPPLARPIETTLVRIRPRATRYELRSPVVIDNRPQGYPVSVNLTYSRRGKATYDLAGPIVIFAPDEFFLQGPGVWLAYSRRGVAKSRLRPPAVVGAAVVQFYGPDAHLAYSRRGKPKSILRKPTVIDLRPQVYYLATSLARNAPKPTTYFLRPPTDTVGIEDQGRVKVELAPSHRLSRKTIWKLRPPTDLVDEADKGRVAIHLTYSLRGKPKSILRKPTVIDLRPQVYTVGVNLTYSRRGKPFYFLRPDSKFAPVPKAEYILRAWLTYSVRGKPKSKLRPPAVIDTRPQVYYLSLTLARNKVKPTRYRLRPPTVVRIFARPTAIHLTYSRRGKPKSRLFGIVYGAKVYAPIGITLVASPRQARKTHPRLTPPTVVGRFTVRPISITLAPQARGKPVYQLSPPTVIDNSPQVYRIATTLVRIRPVPTRYFTITSPVQPTCYGNVVGFDFGPEVCGDDEGATVIGSMTGHQVHGSESSATVTGASAASGSVSGGDEKTEGC